MALKFRRGTTAQQSGSLAFGEPFVNTTLGTLLVGGPNGDIVLSAGGTGSTGNFGPISGSGLDITGNANIAGNLTLGGAITIGDASADTVNVVASVSSSIIPSVTNAFDLGSEDYFWRDIYVSTGSIKFVGAAGNVVGTLTNIGNGLNLDAGIVTKGDSSFGTSSLAVTSVTGSLRVSGSLNVIGGINGVINATNGVVSGSSQVIAILDSLNTFSGSSLTRFTEIGVVSGSLITSASAAKTTNDSQDVSVTNLNSFTSSINTTIKSKLDADGVVSGSSQITYANISSIPAGIISGSSQLSGTSITDLTIVNLTTVNQTASVVFSSGSNRFGDFGDDTHDFTGSVKISGSIVTIGASTATSFNGTINATNGVVSGSSQILGGSGLVSGSSQVTLQSTTGFTAYDTALATITGSLISSASAAKTTNDSQDVSITNLNSATASLLIETANLETFTSSINTTIKTQLDANTVVSGSSQINVASTTGDIALGTRTSGDYVATMTAGTGITVGTATGEGSTPVITNTGVTSNVAGTGVTVSGATGAVTISIGQAVATSSNVQFNSLGVGMVASATAGRIDATNDVVAFSSSDIRFKENIKPIENAIDKIRKISGNTYDWKEENKIEHGYEGNDVGVIAQEIEAVLPQLVQTRESGFKAVKYDKLVALLIEGIKEQQLQIEQLRIDLNNCRNNKGL
jgi:hypothetical protein